MTPTTLMLSDNAARTIALLAVEAHVAARELAETEKTGAYRTARDCRRRLSTAQEQLSAAIAAVEQGQ